MKTRELTTNEAITLWQYAIKNHSKNWGSWFDYPVNGCSYLQFEDNQMVIKFDQMVTYGGETFKRIGWGRRIPGKEAAITFSTLYSLIPESDRPVKEEAPSYEFEHPNGNVFILKQNQFADYKKHALSVRYPDGNVRDGFTNASKLYTQMLECKPEGCVIF